MAFIEPVRTIFVPVTLPEFRDTTTVGGAVEAEIMVELWLIFSRDMVDNIWNTTTIEIRKDNLPFCSRKSTQQKHATVANTVRKNTKIYTHKKRKEHKQNKKGRKISSNYP